MLSQTIQQRMATLAGVPVDAPDLVARAQAVLGVTTDGSAGPKTMAALWQRLPPQAPEVVQRALAGAAWPAVVYSMPKSQGGAGWLPDMAPLAFCDCSGFICQVMGAPKATGARAGALGSLDLGSDGWLAGAGGMLEALPLADARPGDVIGWPSIWSQGTRDRAKGGRIGHVEICFAVDGGKIFTVGCASSNKPSAIVRADKSALWRRNAAVAIRPRWYADAAT